ncbi:hypothetical protein IFM89_034210 [Coptis chinensis]|uniref:Peptidase A1 domain-containing protein n=1 Tax=Coptis chinensis TaxID=261450 RepID=A0A835HAH4_9MAGN|nr:hypothetical protein IFM89_034210 [Coptis chinensis]
MAVDKVWNKLWIESDSIAVILAVKVLASFGREEVVLAESEITMAVVVPSVLLQFLVYTSFIVFVSLLCFGEKSFAYGRDEVSESIHQSTVHVIVVSTILPPKSCSSFTSFKDRRSIPLLKIVHRHSPCSGSFHPEGQKKRATTNQILSTEQILHQDQIRVESLHYKLSNKSKMSQEQSSKATVLPAKSGVSLGTGNYIVRVGFGTPKKYLSLMFDTGSDLTWIQCKPCVRYCHEQQESIFNPSESTSYSNITCNTSECSQLKSATGNTPACGSSSTCIYGIQYGDQSFSVGYFGRETLTLTPRDVFNNFRFGCGQNNRGIFGKTAGLLGLGRNELSFVSQTSQKYGGRFSYCLPSSSSSVGYLAFGVDRSVSSTVKFTPMVIDSRGPSFYFLEIIEINVGDRKLEISASVFSFSGMIIDSGTVITRLPKTAYTSLQSAFQQLMSSYPSAKPLSILDTCYNFTDYDEVNIPKISMLFKGGVTLDLDPSGILIGASASQVCLAFAGNQDDKDVGILGNKQQQKLEVIYDVARSRLGFVPGICK